MVIGLRWTVPWVCGVNNKRRITQIHHSGARRLSSNQLPLLFPLNNQTNSNNMGNYKFICNSVPPGAPGGGGPFNSSWQGWLLGVVVSLIVPFWRNKWMPFLSIKNKVDSVVDTVEAVAEAVESVAEKVEEIADDIGNHLPEGGKLRAAFDLVENIAKETAKDAHIVDDFIEKVEEVEDKVEALIEPVVTFANNNHLELQNNDTTVVVVEEPNAQDSEDTTITTTS